MLETIIYYESSFRKNDLEVTIDLGETTFLVLPPNDKYQVLCKEALQNNFSRAISKLQFKGNQIHLYKNPHETGFKGFGVEFQSINQY